MKLKLPNALIEQLYADDLKGIHIRDVVSIDIKPDGTYTTDVDVELDDDYIEDVSAKLNSWWKSLTSDTSWYKNVQDDWINIHYTDLTDSEVTKVKMQLPDFIK